MHNVRCQYAFRCILGHPSVEDLTNYYLLIMLVKMMMIKSIKTLSAGSNFNRIFTYLEEYKRQLLFILLSLHLCPHFDKFLLTCLILFFS